MARSEWTSDTSCFSVVRIEDESIGAGSELLAALAVVGAEHLDNSTPLLETSRKPSCGSRSHPKGRQWRVSLLVNQLVWRSQLSSETHSEKMVMGVRPC